MKRVIYIVTFLLLLIPYITEATVTNSSSYGTVKTYIFYENDCKECNESINWIKEYINDHTYVTSEYININDNEELFNKVKNNLKIKENNLPLIVFGTNYYIGFDKEIQNKIIKDLETYKDKDYCDIISKINKNEDINACIEKNNNLFINKKENKSSIITWIISSIIIIITIIIGIIFMKKKKK